jgi:uncharacterized membrane protein HdeD (DUF308 family)
MATLLAYRWWTFTWRGGIAILFAGVILLRPQIQLETLIDLFSSYWILEGVFSFWSGLRRRELSPTGWGVPMASGIFSIGMGILALRWPAMNLLAFSYLVAFWSVTKGSFEVTAAVQLRKIIRHEFLLGLAGIVCILFGAWFAIQPAGRAIVLERMLSAFLLVYGALLVSLSFRLKRKVSKLLKLIEIPEDYRPAA